MANSGYQCRYLETTQLIEATHSRTSILFLAVQDLGINPEFSPGPT